MKGLRTVLRRHAVIALLIAALALSVRAVMPTGYMASASPTGITIELCSGVAGKSVTIALPGQDRDQEHGKAHADAPCAFSALGHAAQTATDPILLAIAIAFVVASGLRRGSTAPHGSRARIRPPLRAPPLVA